MMPPEVLEAAVRASVNRDMTGWERRLELDGDVTVVFALCIGYGAELLCALDVRDPLWSPSFGIGIRNGVTIDVNPDLEAFIEPYGMSMGCDDVDIDIRTSAPLNIGRVREIMLEGRGYPSPESDGFEVPFWAEPDTDPYGIPEMSAEPMEFDEDAMQILIGIATTGGIANEATVLCDSLIIRRQGGFRVPFHTDAVVELRYDPGPYAVRVVGKLVPASEGCPSCRIPRRRSSRWRVGGTTPPRGTSPGIRRRPSTMPWGRDAGRSNPYWGRRARIA